jgi:choline kinase
MKAIILAAGRGSRMAALTDERPKCLVELKGRTLLDWQRDTLAEAGVDEIAIVTGYRHELLSSLGLKTFHNPLWADTQMVASLACAAEWLQAEPCIVSYSDIFYEAHAVRQLMLSTAQLAITYDPNWLELWTRRFGDPLLDAETFVLNSDNTLAEIGEKPKSTADVEGQYMGLLRFTPDSWTEVLRIRAGLTPAENDRIHMTGTLQKIIAAGRIPVVALPYEGAWGEVDSADDLAAYRNA